MKLIERMKEYNKRQDRIDEHFREKYPKLHNVLLATYVFFAVNAVVMWVSLAVDLTTLFLLLLAFEPLAIAMYIAEVHHRLGQELEEGAEDE